jgi:hypothetical protein
LSMNLNNQSKILAYYFIQFNTLNKINFIDAPLQIRSLLARACSQTGLIVQADPPLKLNAALQPKQIHVRRESRRIRSQLNQVHHQQSPLSKYSLQKIGKSRSSQSQKDQPISSLERQQS